MTSREEKASRKNEDQSSQREPIWRKVRSAFGLPDAHEVLYESNTSETQFRAHLDDLASINFLEFKDEFFVLDEFSDPNDPEYTVRLMCYLVRKNEYEIALVDPDFNLVPLLQTEVAFRNEVVFPTWSILRSPMLRMLNDAPHQNTKLIAKFDNQTNDPAKNRLITFAHLDKPPSSNTMIYFAQHRQALFDELNVVLSDLLFDAEGRSAHRPRNILPEKVKQLR